MGMCVCTDIIGRFGGWLPASVEPVGTQSESELLLACDQPERAD